MDEALDVTPKHGSSADVPYWQSGWFWAVLALVSTIPFLLAPFPMMPDHFAHTARYHVMNHGAQSPFLPQYFQFEWAIIANLGVDLLMVPLGRLLPTEQAATLAAAMVPPLTIAGIYALARAAHGRVPATALLALMVVFSFTFLFGFENYHLSLALALLCAAAWIRLADAPTGRRWLVMAPFSLVVWLAHFAGWAAMGLIVLGWELARVRRSRQVPQLAGIVLRMLPLALPMAFVPLWQGREGIELPVVWSEVANKALQPIIFFRGEFMWVDVTLILTTALLVAWMLVRHWRSRAMGMVIGCGLLAVAWLALPWVALSSYYVDQRVLAMAFVLFALALPEAGPRQGRAIAAIAIAMFGLRVAEISIGWLQRGRVLDQELAALEKVPMGARIAAFSTPSNTSHRIDIRAPRAFFRPLHGYDHLANLAIVRREAFANTQWDIATGQLMRPIHVPGSDYNNRASLTVRGGYNIALPTLDERVDALPRDRFDFVWSFEGPVNRPWLRLVYTGPRGRLYRILPG
jgi:hypothetical protein